jgi:hypothetical protein
MQGGPAQRGGARAEGIPSLNVQTTKKRGRPGGEEGTKRLKAATKKGPTPGAPKTIVLNIHTLKKGAGCCIPMALQQCGDEKGRSP